MARNEANLETQHFEVVPKLIYPKFITILQVENKIALCFVKIQSETNPLLQVAIDITCANTVDNDISTDLICVSVDITGTLLRPDRIINNMA